MTATSDNVGARLADWRGYDREELVHLLDQARRHSRLVRRLRRILPVLASALVIAMVLANMEWLLSIGPVSVGRISMENGVLKMENPRLSGYSQNDKTYDLSAATATQDISEPNVVHLQGVVAKMTEDDGGWTSLNARQGVFHSRNETLRLEDDIQVRTDKGYEMHLESADIEFKNGNVVSDQPVEIKALNGVLRASRMEITNKGDRMVFSGNVSLVFRPNEKGNSVDGR